MEEEKKEKHIFFFNSFLLMPRKKVRHPSDLKKSSGDSIIPENLKYTGTAFGLNSSGVFVYGFSHYKGYCQTFCDFGLPKFFARRVEIFRVIGLLARAQWKRILEGRVDASFWVQYLVNAEVNVDLYICISLYTLSRFYSDR